jgi:hypothetical protein
MFYSELLLLFTNCWVGRYIKTNQSMLLLQFLTPQSFNHFCFITPTFSSSSILTFRNLQAIHSGKEKKRKEKKKMSKGSSTTADKQITGDPLNFFCTAEAL